MTYIIRHSERIDYTYPQYWKKTKRYRDNYRDPYITKNGYNIIKKKLIGILNDIKSTNGIIPNYIYCSPFARCIETALIMVSLIKDITKNKILIKIEPGLRECYISPFYSQLMDDKMTIKNIVKRYHKYNHVFDTNYKTIQSFDTMKYNSINPYTEINRALDTIDSIHLLNDGFICTHSLNILSLMILSGYKCSGDRYKICGKNNYCSTVKIY